jgi:hypothetical protein
MTGAEYPEDDFRSKMILGAALGIILGALLGASGLFSDVLLIGAALLVVSLFLLETCQPRQAAESWIRIIFKGLFRIIGAILALGIFFGLLFGTAYLIGLVFDLPAWGGYWQRYPVTRGYLLEGFTTFILIIVLRWVFSDRDLPFIEYLVSIFAFSWMFGMIATLVVGITTLPFIFMSIPLAFFNIPPLPAGLPGAVIGGLLGGIFGAALGFVALFTYSVLPDYARLE